ncbi:MAG: hypothetical protein PSV22_16395 [Pseudolabrys sp.]|nr:hypothetical protein [Pseudolabrys sp.]
MANETSALRGEPQQTHAAESPAEDDYLSFSAALGASERGRAFLQEYARRNRHADTAVVLAALDRLESVARSQKAAPEAERIRQDLRALLDTIQSARPQIDQTPGAIKAATLSALIEFVQARIEALVAPAAAAGLHGFLSPVPEPEQPELPIPRPGASAQRGIALVHAISQPADSEPAAARVAPDPFVLSLDPRVGPVFGQQAGIVPPPPRSPNVIPEIDFIDSLFDQIDAKATRQAAADEVAAALAPPVAAAAALPETALAPPPSATVLPPVDMPSIEMAARIATAPAEATADAGETAQAVAFGELIDRTESVADTEANAATIARADALVRATNATADAIDNIVAAAAEAMAEAALAEAAAAAAAVIAEPSIAEIAFGEAGPAETGPVEAGLPEVGFVEAGLADATVAAAELADVARAEAEASIAPAIGDVAPVAPVAVADPAQHVWNNALAAIMALSEEERLALFT